MVGRIVGIQAVGACAVHSSVLLSTMSDTVSDRLIGGAMTVTHFAIKRLATATTMSVTTATAGAVAHLQRVLRHQVSQKFCPHNLVVIWFIL